jgi:hypothetical protein
MLNNLFKRFSNVLWHFAVLNWMLAIMVLIIYIPVTKAEDKDSRAIPEGIEYVWYKGNRKNHVWLADDEIAIFPEQRVCRARGSLEKPLKDLGFNGEVIKENDFVTYMKLSQRRSREGIERMTSEFQNQEEIKCISPVFYSGAKAPEARMALTGEIIIHFFTDWDKNKIEDWSKEKCLRLIKHRFSQEYFRAKKLR